MEKENVEYKWFHHSQLLDVKYHLSLFNFSFRYTFLTINNFNQCLSYYKKSISSY